MLHADGASSLFAVTPDAHDDDAAHVLDEDVRSCAGRTRATVAADRTSFASHVSGADARAEATCRELPALPSPSVGWAVGRRPVVPVSGLAVAHGCDKPGRTAVLRNSELRRRNAQAPRPESRSTWKLRSIIVRILVQSAYAYERTHVRIPQTAVTLHVYTPLNGQAPLADSGLVDAGTNDGPTELCPCRTPGIRAILRTSS